MIGCPVQPQNLVVTSRLRFSSKKSAAIESGIRGSKAHQPRSNLYIGTNQPWNLQTGLYQGESMFELTDPLYRPRSCRSSWFFLFFDFPYFSIRCIFQSVVYYICILKKIYIHNAYLRGTTGSSSSSFDVFTPGLVSYAWHIFPVTFGFQSLGLCCDRWQDPSLQQPRHLHRCSILLGRVDPRKYPHGQQSISRELRKPGHLRQESEFQLRC